MISSSPEYPVSEPPMGWFVPSLTFDRIKPGILLQRKREKVVRTYGKRSQETHGEPTAKRRKAADEEKAEVMSVVGIAAKEEKIKNVAIQEQEVAERCEEREPQANKKKGGSILNFFRPLPPKLKPVPPISQRETTEEPPASPDIPKPRKAPRTLRLRPSSTLQNPPDSSSEKEEEETPINKIRAIANDRKTQIVHDQKDKHKPTFQTTLNISSQAAFSECKVCDSVWNPLFPDDVKYHTKRHAAVLRARSKSDSL